MNTKLIKLYDNISKNLEESDELKKIIISNSFPLLLKISQEQLNLFDQKKEESEDLAKNTRETDYSFESMVGRFGLDEDGAKFLDSILAKMIERDREKPAEEIVSEIKLDFFSGMESGYYWGDWLSTNHEKLKKYLNMFPELRWTPAPHQLSVPFKKTELLTTIPLGGDADQVELSQRKKKLYNEIINEVKGKKEYENLNKPSYQLPLSERSGLFDLKTKMYEEIRERLEKEGIEWEESFKYQNPFESQNFTYRAGRVDQLKSEIENAWHELKKQNDKIISEIDSFKVGSFEPKSPDLIKTYEDSISSIAEYTVWVARKYIVSHLNYRPLSSPSYWHDRKMVSGNVDISELKNLLELKTSSPDPIEDYRLKMSRLSEQKLYCEGMIKNIGSWKSIFRGAEKRIIKNTKEDISKIPNDQIKVLRWIQKFKPEYLKDSYKYYVSQIAANDSDESQSYPVDGNLSNYAPKIDSLNSGELFNFFNLFLRKGTNSNLFQKISDHIISSAYSVTSQVAVELYREISGHIFDLAKKRFEEEYFKYPISRVLKDERSYQDLYKRDYDETYLSPDKIKLFIENWNEKPNLKSFINVILNTTKNNLVLDDFFKIQFSKGIPFHNFAVGGDAIEGDVQNFILRLKTADKEKMLLLAEQELLPNLFKKMVHSFALCIENSISSVDQKSDLYEKTRVSPLASGWRSISPALNSKYLENVLTGYYGSTRSVKGIFFKIQDALSKEIQYFEYDEGIVSNFDFSTESKSGIKEKTSRAKLLLATSKDKIKNDAEELSSENLNSISSILEETASLMISVMEESGNNKRASYISTLIEAVKEIIKIKKFFTFLNNSELVSKTFSGIGFRDISSGIDNLFLSADIQGVSKKDFISLITNFASDGLSEKHSDKRTNEMLSEFLRSIRNKVFEKYTSKVIKALDLKDTKQILAAAETMSVLCKTVNFSDEDLKKSIRLVSVAGLGVEAASQRWANAAQFIHNHSTIPLNYVKNILNSPNFYSKTKISMEFLETCTKLYSLGGVNKLKDPTTSAGSIVSKLFEVGLISDMKEFFGTLNKFSILCANKDGVRPNLGNGTAEMKLDEILVSHDLEKYVRQIPGWNQMDFETRVVNLKIRMKEEPDFPYSENENEMNDAVEEFTAWIEDKYIKKIRETASTKEQYHQDLKIKSIIQSASSILKLVEDSQAMIAYSKSAKKKDERLFDFQWESPSSPFRFRVLKDLDPYHFKVGAETNCCQRIGGVGKFAAIDSFINPLAGVLLLESNAVGEWKVLSQSYFHYVPSSNGVILDNVEFNQANIFQFQVQTKTYFDINHYYAAFAQYIKDKNNLSYVRCGSEHNKLSNSSFTKGKRLDGDPRHFEGSKYTDFSPSSHIDLLSPKFDVKVSLENKKAFLIYSRLIKLAGEIKNTESKGELTDLIRGFHFC